LSTITHKLGSQCDQRVERVGGELAGEEATGPAGLAVVDAIIAVPDLLDQLVRDVPPAVRPRVAASPPPVLVVERPVGVAAPPDDVEQRRQVVLVHEAGSPARAVLAERRQVGVVGDDGDGEGPVHLEPVHATARG
jgi:hypothetical protein